MNAVVEAPRPALEPAPDGRPRVIGARQFLRNFKPLETIIDGMPVARGAIVSITGLTGHGKTTLCALLQVMLCTGRQFAGRDVTSGGVLVLAGENPDDYAMHLLATVQHLGIDPLTLSGPGMQSGLWIVPGTFDVLAQLDHLDEIMDGTTQDIVAVFVDTSAAFFMGEDENDNVAMRRHASILRELASLPGRPTVFVLCHPTKGAGRETLLPRGGGAFLNEIDANLTVWKDEAGIVNLHHAGKIRGPGFDPIRFELLTVELQGHVDCRGRAIYSTAARHVPDERAEQLEERALDDENRILIAMQRKPGGSLAELGVAAGMTLGNGQAHKSKVDRLLKALAVQGLVKQDRARTWRLTPKGRNALEELP